MEFLRLSDCLKIQYLRYLSILFLLPFLFLAAPAYAAKNIVVLSSSLAPVYQQAVESLNHRFLESGLLSEHQFTYVSLDSLQQGKLGYSQDEIDLVITVGSSAADYAVKNLNSAVIFCSFITRNAFNSISAKLNSEKPISAVFMDQPLARLENLSVLLKSDQPLYKVGVLNQAGGSQGLSDFKRYFVQGDVEVSSALLSVDDNPVKVIEPLIKNSDVLIVRPGVGLVNRLVARLALQLSMRYKTPIVGFSRKYAEAGALLSLYASPKDIGLDTANILVDWLGSSDETYPSSQYGDQYSVVVNKNVARKYGKLLDADKLQAALKKVEAEHK